MNATPEAQLHDLERVVTSLLSDRVHTEDELRGRVTQLRGVIAPAAGDDDIEKLIRLLRNRLMIELDLGDAITSQDFTSWLPERKSSVEWSRWKRYKQWMLDQGRAPKVMDTMDQLTDHVLDLVGDPLKEGQWARRGLVIGDVQSGKTATYLGLFNKAADAGFRLIIVLAGNTESLRQQTQARVDEGFIGRDSGTLKSKSGVAATASKTIGVGTRNREIHTAQGMTTVLTDFRKSSQEASNISVASNSPAPYVFVVKKNKSVLNALQDWLQQQATTGDRIDIPVLVLDDESDYASVNTNDENSPTAINHAIRSILGTFTRSSYLAFTATPFANIFIDHENTSDLFPRDFVYSLEAPSNYVGAEQVFGSSSGPANLTHTMDVSDASVFFPPKHKSDLLVAGLPESLRRAIQVFLLVNAVRDLRGDNGGRSMLINVSRFKSVQRQVFDLVDGLSIEFRQAIEMHSAAYAKGRHNTLLSELEETFDDVYSDSGVTWPQVLEQLPASTDDIRVELHNSDRDKRLSEDEVAWDRPPRLIAVGGDVLSRGLTLEGLTVSYFYRSVGAFDTLMQMARWFGYRDGYEDLCRIWIDDEVAADYRFVDEAVKELRQDLAVMKQQKRTPEDFGLAIQKHPGSLMVTARNKMKAAGELPKSVSLSGRRIESTKLPMDPATLESNRQAFFRMLDAVGKPEPESRRRHRRWTSVPKDVIADFLDAFRADQSDPLWMESQSAPRPGATHPPSHLGEFARQSKSPAYQTWDVVVMGGAVTPDSEVRHGELTFTKVKRAVKFTNSGRLLVSGTSSRLAGPSDLTHLLTAEEMKTAEAEYLQHQAQPPKSIPEKAYYPALSRPALLIYPLHAEAEPPDHFAGAAERAQAEALQEELRTTITVAVKIAIPGTPVDTTNKSGDVQYVINTVALRNWMTELGVDDDLDD
ncbi:Z1 domain-containing protein [Janibacter hoylei]